MPGCIALLTASNGGRCALSFLLARTRTSHGQPGCASGGFDHSIYLFLHSEQNFDYARSILHRYQYTDVLYNLCEETYDADVVRRRSPGTYIVHSKGPFFDDAELQVRKIFKQVHGRFPWKKTEQRWWVSFLQNRSDPNTATQDLVAALCCTADYIWRVKRSLSSSLCTNLCMTNTGERCGDTCYPAAERQAWRRSVPLRRAYVWSADFHAGPMACNEQLIAELGVRVHSEVDFSNCNLHPHMCKSRLKELSFAAWRGFSLDPCPAVLRRSFFDAYKQDEEFSRVDMFVCSHPVANCELYMPFDRAILVYATTRMEFGRFDENVPWRVPYMRKPPYHRADARWAEWVHNIRRIASRPGNVVAANNMFDVHAIRYHTGLDALYLPSWCGPSRENEARLQYRPKWSLPVLLGPYRDNLGTPEGIPLMNGTDEKAWAHPIFAELKREMAALRGNNFTVRRMREMYVEYEWSDIVQHPAIIYIPYQVSTIAFFELREPRDSRRQER